MTPVVREVSEKRFFKRARLQIKLMKLKINISVPKKSGIKIEKTLLIAFRVCKENRIDNSFKNVLKIENK